MTQSEKYIEGQWYGWNGGECPVHPETVVDVAVAATKGFIDLYESRLAGDFGWSRDTPCPIIAFRVVKHHVEPKVVWVNEYDNNDWSVYQTKEDATKLAGKKTTRVAVRYVETPE
jgi:hypothetical protein